MALKRTEKETTLEELQAQIERLEDRVSDLEADAATESSEMAERLEKVEQLSQDLLNTIRMG